MIIADDTLKPRKGESRIRPGWWTAILVLVVAALTLVTAAFFNGTFRTFIPVTLTSDRAGLVMEPGGKVKMRGVQVGEVKQIEPGLGDVAVQLEIYPDQVKYIPANVVAQIKATTAFGAKYVDLEYPADPSPARLRAGQVLVSRNVSTEVNTVFQNLVAVLHRVDPAKINAVLTALADGVRDQGAAIGEATSDANQVLLALNPRMDTIQQNFRSFGEFSDAYAGAAQDLLATLNAGSVTATTITGHAQALDALLLNVTGFSDAGIKLIAPNQQNLVNAINHLRPTADLLMKYNPSLTCMLVGAKYHLDNGGYRGNGGNGYSTILDTGLLFGDDAYRYPDNLPINGAKGGPGGKPGCGSLPYVDDNYPVRYLVTNTGWGTGLDLRPNPGIGHPWYVNFFPVTRGVPEPPSIRGEGPPAIGPVPYPGAPPYGAPMYGPDGAPLHAGVPPAEPAPPAGPPVP